MAENRCVVCGQIIPEGRQVCQTCEDISNNSEVMSNKEIEELATEIYTLFRSRPMSRALAHRLYDKGWRKQSEGEWQMVRFPLTKCSICKAVRNCEMDIGWNYCPNCGAHMRGGAE
jgi:hypothetical protein